MQAARVRARPQPLREQLDRLAGPQDRRSAYIREMWLHALEHPEEDNALRAGRDALPYVPLCPEEFGLTLTPESRVLDVGCLGGYGLYDFARRRAAQDLSRPTVVGIDIDPVSTGIGNKMALLWGPGEARFCVASMEDLGFEKEAFSMVIARLVLPYVDVQRALDELDRVLENGGLALIQTHGPAYYFSMLSQALRHLRLRSTSYYARPLLTLVSYLLGGGQPRHRHWRELALTEGLTVRLCRERGLRKVWERRIPGRPQLLFRKEETIKLGKMSRPLESSCLEGPLA